MAKESGKGKPQTVQASELQESIRAFIDRVQFRGERLIVTRYGQPAAVLAPLSPADLQRLEECA